MNRGKVEQIFFIEDGGLRSLPGRSLREGILGSNLEDGLQKLIEQYPQVIPGFQIEPGSEDPPQFVLLCREMSIGGWSLDFLLVDQYAIPTLVECKLIENPESRRAVVGQIIEYAANAADAWGEGRLREKATEYWGRRDEELDEVLSELLGDDDQDVDTFWDNVEENLRLGKMRLIIATDELRPEVRRIIEYLNEETRNVEILGLEIRCYGKDDAPLVLVPRLVGQSQPPEPPGKTKKWCFPELQAIYQNLPNSILGERLLKILEWAHGRGALRKSQSVYPILWLNGKSGKLIMSFYLSPGWEGFVYCFLNDYRYEGDVDERDRFVEKLSTLSIFKYAPAKDADGIYSSAPLDKWNEEDFQTFLEILEEFCAGERQNG